MKTKRYNSSTEPLMDYRASESHPGLVDRVSDHHVAHISWIRKK